MNIIEKRLIYTLAHSQREKEWERKNQRIWVEKIVIIKANDCWFQCDKSDKCPFISDVGDFCLGFIVNILYLFILNIFRRSWMLPFFCYHFVLFGCNSIEWSLGHYDQFCCYMANSCCEAMFSVILSHFSNFMANSQPNGSKNRLCINDSQHAC